LITIIIKRSREPWTARAANSGPRPSGQATNSRALPDPPDCEFDFVNGVTNILFHQHPINIAGQE